MESLVARVRIPGQQGMKRLTDQDSSFPYTLHAVYYFKDRDSRSQTTGPLGVTLRDIVKRLAYGTFARSHAKRHREEIRITYF